MCRSLLSKRRKSHLQKAKKRLHKSTKLSIHTNYHGSATKEPQEHQDVNNHDTIDESLEIGEEHQDINNHDTIGEPLEIGEECNYASSSDNDNFDNQTCGSPGSPPLSPFSCIDSPHSLIADHIPTKDFARKDSRIVPEGYVPSMC